MAGLEQIGRGQEGVVTVQGVHDGEVVLVQVHGLAEVREDGVDLGAQFGLGQQAGGAVRLLDGHALEDGLEGIKLLGQGLDGVGAGEEAAGGGDHEGGHGVVIWTGIVQDVECGSAEGTHCEWMSVVCVGGLWVATGGGGGWGLERGREGSARVSACK